MERADDFFLKLMMGSVVMFFSEVSDTRSFQARYGLRTSGKGNGASLRDATCQRKRSERGPVGKSSNERRMTCKHRPALCSSFGRERSEIEDEGRGQFFELGIVRPEGR